MIISWKEVRDLETFIERLHRSPEALSSVAEGKAVSYFTSRPHLLMPIGFDEYVGFRRRSEYRHMWFADLHHDRQRGNSIYRRPNGQWFLLQSGPVGRHQEIFFHTKNSWDDEESVPIDLHTRESCDDDRAANRGLAVSQEDLFRALYRLASDERPSSEERLWSPTLWTPEAQEHQRIELANIVSPLLMSLRTEQIDFQAYSWRQLEDIVAEVLRRSGLEIHVVKENPQGGRDIIARGQLIPGQEPMRIAVEVKHQRVVDRPMVEAALWQNKPFPALMFVTSGRFTAGVLEEKRKPENQLRLFLKDGIALGDLIKDYFGSRTSRAIVH